MRKLGTFQSVFIEYLIWGIALLLSSVLADRWAYGRWTVNQWNFIRFNLLDGGSHTYGIHPWHWYLSQGLPAMLLTQIPFLFLGIYGDWSAKRRQKQRIPCRLLAFLFVWTTFCYSFLGHKEFRFLFPILPAAMYFCGRGTTIVLKQRSAREKRTLVSSAVILGVLVTQVPVLLYTSLVHQRGTLDAIQFVGRLVEEQHPYEQPNRSSNNMWTPDDWHILCLMPCHSVPSVGFLHKNITIRQLKCDPDLSRWFGEADPHSDEADHFYAHPTAWLWSQLYPIEMSSKSPHVILLFDHLFQTAPQVQHLLLTQWPYRVCGRFFHAHLLTHSRYGHHVLTLCRSDLSAPLVIDP
ncbi:Mannosyltransferase [Fasciola hepatica]|uniref:Mannosyltransferase n=1 Tax=Fasciola hepatica TaxID=6192 RepID=A0A4E0R6K0_FASHE|nr:Mannosyltransferase [Fasciola hepatica]